jgi:hypothetical protein
LIKKKKKEIALIRYLKEEKESALPTTTNEQQAS